MLKVRSPQDFGSAVVIILIGLSGVYFGSELTMGTAGRMGPGYFPRLLSWLIVAIGLFVGFRSFLFDGPPVERPQLRPMFFVLASIIIFGYMMAYVGLAITAVVAVIIAAYAREKVNLLETVIFGIGLSIGTVFVFVYGLGQPLPAWWGY
ncbi:MAG: tripartite tricarboxylate transporter TctB family protein [Xanthobacteraceae bacterium]